MKKMMLKRLTHWILACAALACAAGAMADEAAIRKNIAERLPRMPAIEEVRPTPMPGLFEIRVNGADLFYTDAEGSFLIEGTLVDTKAQRNLTEERVNRITAIDFATLPFKDAFTIVRGSGARKLAVFEDPNCGYCKQFEAGLQKIDNVTIYMFLYPILGQDSAEKSRSIWCAKEKGKVWQDWMVRGQPIPPSTGCDVGALARNVEFGRKYKITGTPTLLFADGSRVPGAIGAAQVEAQLANAK